MPIKNKGNIIESPQTITGSWVDIGGEIEVFNYSFISIFIKLDINDSENVQFRFRGLYEASGDEYLVAIKFIRKDKVLLHDFYYELDNDVDQNIIIQTDMDQNLDRYKLQVKAETVGATAGIITDAKYIQGYRQ